MIAVPTGLRHAVRARLAGVERRYDDLRFSTGSIESRLVRDATPRRLRDVEFRVFSQWGHDGIIQYLVHHVPIEVDTFVEFGVESYRESNTRFLLMHDNWRGVIIDGGIEHQAFLDRSGLRFRHTIDAYTSFITKDNINRLLTEAGLDGDIGLLSVDIDGNDYWVLDAIDVISPRILIVEYNALFGDDRAVAIPYDADFSVIDAHASRLYFGASLPAFIELAGRKGYRFVGTTSAGADAFFVRNDVADALPPLDATFTDVRFRQARDAQGALTYTSGRRAQLELIARLPLVDVVTGEPLVVGDLLD